MIDLRNTLGAASLALLCVCSAACGPSLRLTPTAGPLPPVIAEAKIDTAPKRDLRLVPPEVYLRSYLALFGEKTPADVQKRARGNDGGQLFDTWDDYLAALGFPDYRADLPRATQTNAIMVATFERLGVALCDRAVEHDLQKPVAGEPRRIFDFDAPKALDANGFTTRFDVLHRTFLGYPAALAPPTRAREFYALYTETVERHTQAKSKSRFSPELSGWAVVCYGLVRHPELHLY